MRTDLTVIPQGFKVTQCPAKVAQGAYKPRNTGGGGAVTTGVVAAQANRRSLLSYAAKSHR